MFVKSMLSEAEQLDLFHMFLKFPKKKFLEKNFLYQIVLFIWSLKIKASETSR